LKKAGLVKFRPEESFKMRASRAPEGRGVTKRVLLLATGIATIAAVVAAIYLTVGSDSLSAKSQQDPLASDVALASSSARNLAVPLEPTATPDLGPVAAPAPEPVATSAPKPSQNDDAPPQPTAAPTAQPQARTVPAVFPGAHFGEVLEEGLVELKYPSGALVPAWYSFQVDTETGDITLFFAQYDEAMESIIGTVMLDDYTRGVDLDDAEVLLNYPDGTTRTLLFDGNKGTISLNQQYVLPTGPSMFSSGLRRALVYYGMKLQDEAGEIEVELHLDLSGLSQSEGMEFKRLAPDVVDDVLFELQFLVEQIEDKRLEP